MNDKQLRKVMSFCPYCHSEAYPKQEDTIEVIYKCGSSGNRITGLYKKQCEKENKNG